MLLRKIHAFDRWGKIDPFVRQRAVELTVLILVVRRDPYRPYLLPARTIGERRERFAENYPHRSDFHAGAKMARGRSPIVAALIALLVSRALANNSDEKKPEVPGTEEGLGGLMEKFRKGGLEEIIKSWIGTGANKPISPNQLHQALGPETVDGLSQETGLPRDDLLSQLSRLLPEVIDKLSPDGKLPKDADLLPGPETAAERAKSV
jgi:uncharacterized protein YidB (DUF937 family)